jgi:hypothetical protein
LVVDLVDLVPDHQTNTVDLVDLVVLPVIMHYQELEQHYLNPLPVITQLTEMLLEPRVLPQLLVVAVVVLVMHQLASMEGQGKISVSGPVRLFRY